MTTSQVDITFPADNVRVSKSSMRTQLETIRDELDVLFAKVGEAGRIAFTNTLTASEIQTQIVTAKLSGSYARTNLAFEWRAL